MKKINLPLNIETKNYLQRLGYEVDSKAFIIDRLFTNHKNDVDESLFNSIPFKKYMKEYEEVQAEYSLAKNDLTQHIKKIISQQENLDIKTIQLDWNIPNFDDEIIEVTIYD